MVVPQLGCIVASDDQGESGVARRLKMMPVLQFVRNTRSKIQTIYDANGGIVIEFDKVQVATIDERSKEYELLKQARTDGAITPDEFNEKVSNLL